MPDDPKQVVISRIRELREALAIEPISDRITNARHQCDRLEHGISLAHPEGIRFAAHTLLRLLDSSLAPPDPHSPRTVNACWRRSKPANFPTKVMLKIR